MEKNIPKPNSATSQIDDQMWLTLRPNNLPLRIRQMKDGLSELENWLSDILRQGIATLENQPVSFWKSIAARMVDAKLGNIAKRIMNIPTIIENTDQWPERVLTELSVFYLLIQGFSRLDDLPLPYQQDLLSFAGVNFKKESLFQVAVPTHDLWLVLGQVQGIEGNLNFRKTWISGFHTGRYGLILDFAFGNQPFSQNYIPGTVFDGLAVYYPSNSPLRMAVKEKKELKKNIKRIPGFADLSEFLKAYAQNLSANPLQTSYPCSIENVIPVFETPNLYFTDRKKNAIPVRADKKVIWRILAISGGNPVAVFGQWSGDYLNPLSLTIENRFYTLSPL